MQDISQVSYVEKSGTILPELQLFEEIVITKDKVTLSRNGKTEDTEVNEGIWEIEVVEQEVATFFKQIEAIDCSSIKRVEPKALEIGGGTKSYSILYAGDKTFYLDYDRGVTYTDGSLLTEPIQAFIEGLGFPASAASRYKSQMSNEEK
jgi:hypothetical protein